ncbi:hypothetical protein A3K34_04015 [candidate division WWE3 bacterium RIFOXYC1_FULL_40_10]|uniref:DUF5667 domain-containing protein n=1 Tax=candidate division WWE3 bacterium RIFOXYA2_FULL_46_9 TaxID=1802636 RepID=A0A1F4W0H9_UNCKA|nr:MAG: hypothetical protein A3K58_04015 [candidate division WWE3 bacterium RIFOXYB1_FULL_40_22]OGC62007.1 MAG: hypothetical protein A3K37_04015 [candidate division WWE3 bacterium RIFOXYA1_FULL_40_11]OGC62924.1 MAG: hypothetical protein A2264_03530 [candidate division WWE3 bacterium RIFOXYA2_FULL_46_9]OGC65050.1 MAG: hypothetical protein A2326_03365 [candidate division WWE3 bacterium RIFOXYB2_FULL_41_6]OGC66390.1 MAG: hypothetical protein A3K34_04015 [candidate division WWE3 bacterium RIFOXYC1_
MNKKARVILILTIWAGYFSMSAIFVQRYVADVSSEKAMELLSKGDIQGATYNAGRAVLLNKLEPSYYRNKARVEIASLVLTDLGAYDSKKSQILEDLDLSLAANRNNLVTKRNLVPLYYFLALRDLTSKELDDEYTEKARAYYSELKRDYKNDAGVLVLIARYEKKLGLTEDLADTKKLITVLRPDLVDWAIN